MSVFSCCAGTFATLSRAAAKAAKARLREIGWGRVAPDWPRRAQECERCPLRVIRGGITYCGKPLLEETNRTDPADGCGCPTIAKAKSPEEHCPLDRAHRPAMRARDGACTCKWCSLSQDPRRRG